MDEISVNISPNINRAILTTKNIFVDEINEIMIRRFPGEEVEYNSFDETLDPNDQAHYEDLLHTLTPNGISPHKLVLKHKAPIILLRNLDPTEGLCNGTRLFCVDFNRNVIRAQIAFGEFAGKEVFIHRIPLQPTTGEQYTVLFKINQFPIIKELPTCMKGNYKVPEEIYRYVLHGKNCSLWNPIRRRGTIYSKENYKNITQTIRNATKRYNPQWLIVETTTNSGIMINAPTPSLLSLKYWYNKNKREISQLIEKKLTSTLIF